MLPVPVVAAINGHCFAGGMMLSLACDYRVMTDGSKRNAWITMNEVRGSLDCELAGHISHFII
jgi:Delta3-Delta2-enoyl-CoA isomerase